MTVSLKLQNIVVIGIFNTALYDRYFFIKNKLATEEELSDPQNIFNNLGNYIQVKTNLVQIDISPNQIILTSIQPTEKNNSVSEFLKILLVNGDVFQITAMGMNFHWFASDSIDLILKSSKKFFNENIELYNKHFTSSDSVFGGYASTNFLNSRLKLDIKPTLSIENRNAGNPDSMMLIFNFHFDIKDKSEVLSYLNNYAAYVKKSEEISISYN